LRHGLGRLTVVALTRRRKDASGGEGGMKFLVRMWAIHPMTVGPKELSGLALQQLEYWDRLQQEGKVIFTAPYVGQRARVAIYEVDSTDELFDLINDDPLFGQLDREITALSSNEKLRALYQKRFDTSSS
jgi:muconolactone delta-isomerase